MDLAMAWPWIGPNSRVRRISRSRVPCSMSIGSSFCLRIDALVENQLEYRSALVECQGKGANKLSRAAGFLKRCCNSLICCPVKRASATGVLCCRIGTVLEEHHDNLELLAYCASSSTRARRLN